MKNAGRNAMKRRDLPVAMLRAKRANIIRSQKSDIYDDITVLYRHCKDDRRISRRDRFFNGLANNNVL